MSGSPERRVTITCRLKVLRILLQPTYLVCLLVAGFLVTHHFSSLHQLSTSQAQIVSVLNQQLQSLYSISTPSGLETFTPASRYAEAPEGSAALSSPPPGESLELQSNQNESPPPDHLISQHTAVTPNTPDIPTLRAPEDGRSDEQKHKEVVVRDAQASDEDCQNKWKQLGPIVDAIFPNTKDVDFGLPCDAWYVNLDRSEDRREVFEQTFGALWGDRLHRHRGVDYKNQTQIVEVVGDTPRGREIAGFCTPQIACILSHLTAVRAAYVSGAEAALIVEDDIGPYLMPYWTVGLGDLLQALKVADASWDTVMLWWATEDGSAPPENATWVGKNLIKSPYLWGTSAYLISRQGMQKVMDRHFPEGKADSPAVLTFEGELTIDGTGYYGGMMEENYIAYPGMFVTHSKQSTIQTDSWHFGFHTKMGAGHWTESIRRWQSKYYPSLKR